MKRVSARSRAGADVGAARPPFLSELALAILFAFAPQAFGNPTGATVVSGQASVSSAGKTLTVTNTPGAIINWRGFSIAPDELTRFIQQGATSSVLNRVVGQDPSRLLGQLQSNGRVFLINPNGIVFGSDARIDVGGLVASTLAIADADFLAGRLRFSASPGAGALTQLGSIRTPSGGQVVLIATSVENAGVITTPQGEVLLAAGHSVQLADSANPELRVTVSAPAGAALNLGALIAEGGRIGIHAGLIAQHGSLGANRAEVGAGGEIFLKASGDITLGGTSRIDAGGASGGRIAIDGATVTASGTIAATGSAGAGGSIRIAADTLRIPDARIDASGTRGGGEILAGGDLHGANPALRNARSAEVGAAATLRADAVEAGPGGKVVVWSDRDTRFAGGVSARGGALGGDGGLVEVSGKETLAFAGSVDTRAPRGTTGTLLLDPSDITISSGADASMTLVTPFEGTAATSNLSVATLQAALATSNVVVDTTNGSFASAGNIAVDNAVTWGSGNALELRAHNNITVALGATINATGAGALRLIANQDAVGGGDVAVNAALTAHSGGIAISGVNVTTSGGAGGGSLTTTGLANANAGAVTIAATGVVNLGSAIVASGGVAGAAAPGRSGGAVTVGGTTVTTAAITASGSAANGALQTGGNAGTVSLTASGALVAGTIIASTGAAGTTAAGGTAGSVTLQGTSVAAGALTTTGGANGAGGTITATATSGLLNVTGAITTTGGAANASSAGRNAGNVTLSGVGVTTTSITANGSAGVTAGSNRPGGAGGSIAITSTGGITTAAIAASGGAATTTNAAGGNSGSIAIANSGAGNVVTTALTARTGAASGSGAGGSVGAGIAVSNSAGNLRTGSLNTAGGTSGNGGNIVLSAAGTVTTTAASTITTSGGALAAGANRQGTDAGDVTITGSTVSMPLAAAGALITANGGAALTLANARGGNAGAIAVTANAGAINFSNGNLSALGGNAVAGVGAGGAADDITLTATGNVTANAITIGSGAAFGTAGPGGSAATLSVSGGNVALGAVTATGGLNGDGSAVTVNAAGTLTTGAVTDNGGAGRAGTAGGNAGTVTLTSNGTLFTGALAASGGAGGAGTAAGGNGGTIIVTNASTTTGTLTTAGLSAQSGVATGATVSGAPGSISVTNHAPTLLQVGAINTWGLIGAAGGDVSLSSAGNVTSGGITTYGGALTAGTAAAGRAGGSVTIEGVDRNIAGVTTFGAAAVVSGFGGSNGGNVVLTGPDGTAATAGLLSVPAVISTFSGAAVGPGPGAAAGDVRAEGTTVSTGGISAQGIGNGTGGTVVATASSGALTIGGAVSTFGGAGNAGSPGGTAGSATLQGQSVTAGQITSFGGAGNGADQAGGAGGAVSVLASGGNLSVGAIYAYGGNGVAGNASGGNGGAITLDAPGAGRTITIGGITVMSSGGSSTGTGTPGSGAAINVTNDALLATTPVTFLASGAGGTPGGHIHFHGTLDSSGAASALTITTNGVTTFDGAVGAASPLASLTSTAGGTTLINGGSITTTGVQTFGSAVTIGGDTALNAGAGNVTFSQTLNGPFDLDVTTTGNATFSGAIGAVAPLQRLGVSAGAVTVNNSATVTGGPGSAIDLLASRNICINCTAVVPNAVLTSNGAPITLVANPSGVATGFSRALQTNSATFDAGGGDITMTGTGGNSGLNDMGIQMTNTSLRTIGSGSIALTGTGRGAAGRGVSVFSSVAGVGISTVDGDIRFTGTGSGTTGSTLSNDVSWVARDESQLRTTGSGSIYLTALGSGDFNGLNIGTSVTPLDFYGPALNQWNLSTASNFIISQLGVAKTTGGDATWFLTAPNSIEFIGGAGVDVTSGRLDLVFAPATGAVSLGTGTFRSNGGNITLAGGSNPGGLVNPAAAATGAQGTSAYVYGVGSFATIDAGDGNIWAMGTGNPGTGNGNYGIYVQGALSTSGPGDITLNGTGGGSGGSGTNGGVVLWTGSVQTSGSGSIDITGTGGSVGSGANAMGVRIFAFNTIEALGSGTITITGQSGNNGVSTYNPGIDVGGVVAGGGGAVSLTGVSGSALGNNNVGITLLGTVSNVGSGTIDVLGVGGGSAPGTGTGNAGLGLVQGTITGVDGTVNVTGVGGSSGGSGNHGLTLPMAGGGYGLNTVRTTGAGNLNLTGVAGTGGTGIVAAGNNVVQTSGTGSITLSTDSIGVGAPNTINSAAALTIQPYTSGTSLGVGSAAAGTLGLSDAALANLSWDSGSTLTLGGASTGATTIDTTYNFANPLAVVSGSGADITLAAPLASSSGGALPAVVLDAGRNFVNGAGAAAIVAPSGTWRIYSTDPGADSRGGLVADFKQYGAQHGITPVLGSGDGFLYRIAPTVTPGLTGSVAKVYDGSTTASLGPVNYSVAGAIDGDSVVLGGGIGSYASRHAGTGKLVDATGISIVGASNGGILVYGYGLAATTASAAVGSIAPAPLSLAASPDSKVYDGSTASAATPVVAAGLVAGDSVGALVQGFDSAGAGARSLTVTGFSIADGNGGANYSVTRLPAAGRIDPAPLTIAADDKSRTTAQPNPPLTATVTGFVAGETAASALTGSLTLSTPADASAAAGGYAIVPAGQTAANYAITYLNGTLTVTPAAPPPPAPPTPPPVPPTPAPPATPPAPALPLVVLTGEVVAERDARLGQAQAAGGSSGWTAQCAPAAPKGRLCAGWPVCESPRPVCPPPPGAAPPR